MTIVPPDPRPEQRRRSQRLKVRIPVLVRTLKVGKHPMSEKTHTIEVNAHGTLILLATEVGVDQFVILTNAKTGEELTGRVVSLGPNFLGKTQVRVELIKPSPDSGAFPLRLRTGSNRVALRNGAAQSLRLQVKCESLPSIGLGSSVLPA